MSVELPESHPRWFKVKDTQLYRLKINYRYDYFFTFIIAIDGIKDFSYEKRGFHQDEILFKTYSAFELLEYINDNSHNISKSDVMIEYILFNEI